MLFASSQFVNWIFKCDYFRNNLFASVSFRKVSLIWKETNSVESFDQVFSYFALIKVLQV